MRVVRIASVCAWLRVKCQRCRRWSLGVFGVARRGYSAVRLNNSSVAFEVRVFIGMGRERMATMLAFLIFVMNIGLVYGTGVTSRGLYTAKMVRALYDFSVVSWVFWGLYASVDLTRLRFLIFWLLLAYTVPAVVFQWAFVISFRG